MTPAEALLWRSLRGSRAGGWKWRRQQVFNSYEGVVAEIIRICSQRQGKLPSLVGEGLGGGQ